ncbi:hypothetical protein ACH427_16220 [Streptomyces sp. NPDC020379]|uniref:hypothetical protein n=1 Tax=Streptomyces sp. NPDC020379 TaxID=3365071 RepID=UPI0037B69AAF
MNSAWVSCAMPPRTTWARPMCWVLLGAQTGSRPVDIIGVEAREHRAVLGAALSVAGLVNYPAEW